MEIVVIDGQGGGIGKNIIQVLKEKHPEYTIIGVGTNSMATTQLKKGGADIIATGKMLLFIMLNMPLLLLVRLELLLQIQCMVKLHQLWQKLLEKVKRVNILFLFLNAVLKL